MGKSVLTELFERGILLVRRARIPDHRQLLPYPGRGVSDGVCLLHGELEAFHGRNWRHYEAAGQISAGGHGGYGEKPCALPLLGGSEQALSGAAKALYGCPEPLGIL